MAKIRFSNGTVVNFDGNPTQADVEEVVSQMGIKQPEQPNQYGAIFRATGDETGLQAGLKAAGNIPTSVFNLGKGVVQAITSPVETIKGVGSLVTDAGRKVTNKLTDVTGLGEKQETPTLDAFGDVLADRYGSTENAQTTAIEDPFGVGADIAGILSGGAATLGKTAQLGTLTSKVAKVATAPVRVPAKAVGNITKKVTGFGTSQATGLAPETLKTVMTDSSAFNKAQKAGTTRVDLADDVFSAVNKASDELSDLGSGYNTIRESGSIVTLPDNWAKSALDKYGLKFEDGQVLADRSSRTRNVTDINKIQSFVDNWGDSKAFTSDEYLNMRHDLSELAKYDQAGSNVARDFASTLREGTLNSDKVRNQITGLKELDSKYASDVQFYNKLKKDFLDVKGNLKDGAASKVVNSVTAANPERLARLEKLYPGFTKQAQVIKALEDVESAMGLKVGTYARAGAGITGIATGNLPLIIASIIATPEIALPLLKGLGLTAEKISPVIKAVRGFADDINNFRTPDAITKYIEKEYPDGIPIGMSIKSTGSPLELEAKKYKSGIEYAKAKMGDDFEMGRAFELKREWENITKPIKDLKTIKTTKDLEKLAKDFDSLSDFEEAFSQENLHDLSNRELHRWGRALPESDMSRESVKNFVDGESVTGSLKALKSDNPLVYKKVTSPSKNITMYRAVPDGVDSIGMGDFIALDRKYAEDHMRGVLEGMQKTNAKIVETTVPKTDVIWHGNDYSEWIYSPQSMRDKYPKGLEDIWKKANQQ